MKYYIFKMFTTTVFITSPILVFPYAVMAGLRWGKRWRQRKKAATFAACSKPF